VSLSLDQKCSWSSVPFSALRKLDLDHVMYQCEILTHLINSLISLYFSLLHVDISRLATHHNTSPKFSAQLYQLQTGPTIWMDGITYWGILELQIFILH